MHEVPPVSDSALQGQPSELPHDSFPFTPLSDREPPPLPVGHGRRALRRVAYWCFSVVGTLVILRVFVPYFVEHIQYAVTRGRLRAQVEIARDGLESLPLDQLSTAYQLVAQRVAPSVVHIEVGRGENANHVGAGSGVVLTSDGYILTNNHVVHATNEIQVTLSDGRVTLAEIVSEDRMTDLAVIKVSADGLIPAEWGDSEQLEVGHLVWAVGSPFNLQQSVTAGILSGKNREKLSRRQTPLQRLLQTDAAVNPGNSGGPLVNIRGQVIGINTAIVGESYQGASLAIPSNLARSVSEQLLGRGHVVRGWLGVSLDTERITSDPTSADLETGAVVIGLTSAPGPSPAGDAGIIPGDIIIRWNGDRVDDSIDLIRAVVETKVGTIANVDVLRGDTAMTFEVKVGRRPTTLE